MKIHRALAAALIAAALSLPAARIAVAQAPPATAGSPQVHANLAQLMRGVLFTNSNVVFYAQDKDPETVKPDADRSTAVNPLAGVYNGWQAIENSGLAMAEAANLLTVPGRPCSNGRPVPITDPEWMRFVQELRDAGMASYKAGQAKSQDAVLEASDLLVTACSNCHDVYREKTEAQGGMASRCIK